MLGPMQEQEQEQERERRKQRERQGRGWGPTRHDARVTKETGTTMKQAPGAFDASSSWLLPAVQRVQKVQRGQRATRR